jgi:hypothetical protein
MKFKEQSEKLEKASDECGVPQELQGNTKEASSQMMWV